VRQTLWLAPSAKPSPCKLFGRRIHPRLCESDVTLRITIDSKGPVTDAEIIKSGGAGFDGEALKAVKQARFEPAQTTGMFPPCSGIFTG